MFRIIFNPSIKIVIRFLKLWYWIISVQLFNNREKPFYVIFGQSASLILIRNFQNHFFYFFSVLRFGVFLSLSDQSASGIHDLRIRISLKKFNVWSSAEIMVMERSLCRGGGADWKYLNVLHLSLYCEM